MSTLRVEPTTSPILARTCGQSRWLRSQRSGSREQTSSRGTPYGRQRRHRSADGSVLRHPPVRPKYTLMQGGLACGGLCSPMARWAGRGKCRPPCRRHVSTICLLHSALRSPVGIPAEPTWHSTRVQRAAKGDEATTNLQCSLTSGQSGIHYKLGLARRKQGMSITGTDWDQQQPPAGG